MSMGHQLNFFRVLIWPCLKMYFFRDFVWNGKMEICDVLLKKFWENGEIWSNKIISPSSISLIADLQRLFIDISNCYDSPGGNNFSSKSKGNWCAVLTHRISIIEIYAHTDLSNKNASCYIAAFPLSVLWYRLKQDYEQRNIELNHEKLLFKWLVFLLCLHQRRRWRKNLNINNT